MLLLFRFKLLVTLTVLLVPWLSLTAQEQIGLISGNFAGTHNIRLNPSLMHGSRLYMDYNLLTVHTFFDNNYIYWEKQDVFDFLQNRTLPEYYTEENEPRTYGIFRDAQTKKGYQQLYVGGPAAMVVYKRHAFGLSTSLRSMTSFRDIPPDIAVFLYEAIDYNNLQQINFDHLKNMTIASFAWAELGLSYAYNFHRYRWSYWSAGITLKPLFGLDAALAEVDNVNYQVHNDDSASIYDVTFRYGYALPIDYTTNTYDSKPLFKGSGFAVDAGVTWAYTAKGHSTVIFNRLCEQPYEDYNVRVGLSVLDLGFIKYRKNTTFYDYSEVSTEWYRPYDTIAVNSLEDLNGKIADFFSQSSGSPEPQKEFIINLPTVISLQADYHYRKYWYLNLLIYQPLKFSKQYIYRPQMIALTPRYETARFEVAIPISLYDYDFDNFRIGGFIRYGNVFAGADQLLTWVKMDKVTGIDFYAGIRLNLSNVLKMNFIKGYCGMRKAYNIETFDYRNF
ncbi:MAG: hypothetical protein Kow00127_09490 [Bacteroidales bacterium]